MEDIDGECRKARSVDYIFTLILTFNLLAELKKCSLINFFNKKVAQFADF